jgi:hypothetical protein
LLHPLTHWRLEPGEARSFAAISDFLEARENFYAYAGQKFDTLVSCANKKYQLSLPLSFYDWAKWDWSFESPTVTESLAEAMRTSEIVETVMDRDGGMLWIIALPALSRTIGTSRTSYAMPPTLDGFTDFLKHVYMRPRDPERKAKGGISPAQLIRNKLDYSAILPGLQERLSSDRPLYGLPLDVMNSAASSSSFFFESNMKVAVSRDLVNGCFSFGYTVYFKHLLEFVATERSVMFVPLEYVRMLLEFPFTVTLFFNDQSLFYRSGELSVKSVGDSPILITKEGMVMAEGDAGEVMVLVDGTIGHMENGVWTYIRPDGRSFRGGVELDIPHSRVVDLQTNTTTMIRSDGIDYAVLDSGVRRIQFRSGMTIEQDGSKWSVDTMPFPLIYIDNGVVTVSLDRFQVTLSEHSAEIAHPDYTIKLTDDELTFASEDTEMYMRPSHGEFKSGDNVLIADADGTERRVQVNTEIPNKKNIEVFNTHWGRGLPIKDVMPEAQQLELHRLFPPRFFVVRDDLSCTEFMRSDTVPREGFATNSVRIEDAASPINFVTLHKVGIPPVVYIQHEPLSKAARSNLLKALHLPTKKKGKSDEADENLGMMATHAHATEELMNYIAAVGERTQEQFEASVMPEAPPKPEVLVIPPCTPLPRLMHMQAHRHETATRVNFWKSSECEFAIPVVPRTAHIERPFSPRVALFDPPRALTYRNDAPLIVTPRSQRPASQVTVPKSVSTQNSTRRRPVSVAADPCLVNFGTMKENTAARASIAIRNLGPKPLHFSAMQPEHEFVKVLTLPGTIYPAFKVTLLVAILPCPPQEIVTHFVVAGGQIQGASFEMKIPVTANIVPVEE